MSLEEIAGRHEAKVPSSRQSDGMSITNRGPYDLTLSISGPEGFRSSFFVHQDRVVDFANDLMSEGLEIRSIARRVPDVTLIKISPPGKLVATSNSSGPLTVDEIAERVKELTES